MMIKEEGIIIMIIMIIIMFIIVCCDSFYCFVDIKQFEKLIIAAQEQADKIKLQEQEMMSMFSFFLPFYLFYLSF